MSSLLAHALKQEICLPVAHLLVLVRTAPQLFKLAAGRGLYDGLQRLDARFSSSLGQGPRLPPQDHLRHLVDGLFCPHDCPSPWAYSSLLAAAIPVSRPRVPTASAASSCLWCGARTPGAPSK